ncbi:TldD/PmbA family protein [Natronospirillum operosum]|uniref:TldD/PmbA family protein n=1 Tax=Natronospirillum operosum TaxID=2759953 RepID=A0A4Z0WBS7_9GAMM|nr:TldD/PmbA family protein [Natronospirillum operosum]TGG91665.1 TldD/PmbA family protein [Natronospirillum operosum]
MLDVTTARRVLDHALAQGADFADLFVERQQRQSLRTLLDQVEDVQSGLEFGIGIRLVYGHQVLYGYTNQTGADVLCDIVGTLAARDRRDPVTTATALDFRQPDDRHPTRVPLSVDTALAEKIDFLRRADQAARAEQAAITRTIGNILQREQQIEVFNSEGLHTRDVRHYCRVALTAVATDGQEQATGSDNIGGLLGWEVHSQRDPAALGAEAARQAGVNLGAKPCPSGRMPVVIGNGFGGVIFHEACGHLLETTAVAKQASVFHDQMGEMIASPVVSAVDDGTIDNAWGSLNIDDEGMPTQRTQLIKDGRLTSFMVDRLGSQQTGFARTGSGRRESYRFAPASRMRNTFIEAGKDDFNDMIASMDRGIYAASMGGGSVQPGTGEFNFAVTEGYYVENGKIQYPVKAATLISTGPAVLKEISMVGPDLDLACGMCGSVSGAIPTTVGQPALKVDDILVGGNA